MNTNYRLIPVNAGIRLLQGFIGVMMYMSGLIIYIAGGITILVAVACFFFGLITGDGLKHLIIGSITFLMLLLGASAAAAALIKGLTGIKEKTERR